MRACSLPAVSDLSRGQCWRGGGIQTSCILAGACPPPSPTNSPPWLHPLQLTSRLGIDVSNPLDQPLGCHGWWCPTAHTNNIMLVTTIVIQFSLSFKHSITQLEKNSYASAVLVRIEVCWTPWQITCHCWVWLAYRKHDIDGDAWCSCEIPFDMESLRVLFELQNHNQIFLQ